MTIVAWALSLLGAALWVYGYFVPGHAPIVDWPQWIGDWIPNLEAEIGLLVCCIGSLGTLLRRPT